MPVRIAKHPSVRNVHVGRNFRLLLEEEHAELQEGEAHLAAGRGIESSRHVDASYFGSKRRGNAA